MSSQLLQKIIFHQKQVLQSLENLVKILPETSLLQQNEECGTVPHFPPSVRPPFFLPRKETSSCTPLSSPKSKRQTFNAPPPLLLPEPHFPLAIRSAIYPKSNFNIASQELKSAFDSEVKPIPHIPRSIRPAQTPQQNSFADVVRAQNPATPKLTGGKQFTPDLSFLDTPSTFTPCSLPISLFPSETSIPQNEQTPKHKTNFKSNNLAHRPAPKNKNTVQFKTEENKNKLQFNKEEKLERSPMPTKVSKQSFTNRSSTKLSNLQKFDAKGRHFREQIRQMQIRNAPPEQRMSKPSVQEKNKRECLTLLLKKHGAFQKVKLEPQKPPIWVKKISAQASEEKKGDQCFVEDFEKKSRLNVLENKKMGVIALNLPPCSSDTTKLSFMTLFDKDLNFSFFQSQVITGNFIFSPTPQTFFISVAQTESASASFSFIHPITEMLELTTHSSFFSFPPFVRVCERETDSKVGGALQLPQKKLSERAVGNANQIILPPLCAHECVKKFPQTKKLSKALNLNTQCPNGHISFQPTNFCRLGNFFGNALSPCFSDIQLPPNQVQQTHLQENERPQKFTSNFFHCPNGHISFSQTSFCRFSVQNRLIQKEGAFSSSSTLFNKTQKTLVLRIRGGGGIEVPIPEHFVPRIDFDLVENQEQAKEPPRLTFLQLIQKMSLNEPASLNSYGQIDMVSNKFTPKIVEEFLKSFFSLSGDQVTLLLILKTQNIPRSPLASLSKDTRPFVQVALPFLQSANLNLQPGKPGVIVAVLSKAASPTPISQIYFKNGIVQPLSGTNKVIVIETFVRVKNKESKHKEIFEEIFPGFKNEIDTLIVCGEKIFGEHLFLRFLFFTKRENLSLLLQLAEKSWENEKINFWVADTNVLDSICENSFDFSLVSGYLPDFLLSGSKKVMELSKLTTKKVLSLLPKNHTSMFIVSEKGSQDFFRLLLENSFQITLLSPKGAKTFLSAPALMVYPIPNSKDGKCAMNPEELKETLENLLQTKKIEPRKKGFRIFCDSELLETWRNFEGFLNYQKVRMCKEKEKERERSLWWTSLRGQQKDAINEKRKVAFLRIAAPQITLSLPAVKRRRSDSLGDHEES